VGKVYALFLPVPAYLAYIAHRAKEERRNAPRRFSRKRALEKEEQLRDVVSSMSGGVTDCPSCKRYIGPLEVCWYCRHRVKKRPIVRLIKYGSVVGAVLGLVILQQIGASLGTPHVDISQLVKTCNFASIEISGRISQPVSFYPAEAGAERLSGTVTFIVDDGTGVIDIKAYESVTRELIEDNKIPSLGDKVTLTGTLHIRGNKKSIILPSAAFLAMERIQPSIHTPMGDIAKSGEDAFDDLERVTVYGKVKTVRSGDRSVTVVLEDRYDNDVEVVFYRSLLELNGVFKPGEGEWPGVPKEGRFIVASGVLRRAGYGRNRTWKVFPSSPGDMIETDEETCHEKNASGKR